MQNEIQYCVCQRLVRENMCPSCCSTSLSRNTQVGRSRRLSPCFSNRFFSSYVCENNDQVVNFTDNLGRTPLHYACIMSDESAISILQKANAKKVRSVSTKTRDLCRYFLCFSLRIVWISIQRITRFTVISARKNSMPMGFRKRNYNGFCPASVTIWSWHSISRWKNRSRRIASIESEQSTMKWVRWAFIWKISIRILIWMTGWEANVTRRCYFSHSRNVRSALFNVWWK